jgi:hypothetical protein
MSKLAIIVPYRDREEHLARFVPHMEKFLSDKKIDFKIFVVEFHYQNNGQEVLKIRHPVT